jgi:hypothetical protein
MPKTIELTVHMIQGLLEAGKLTVVDARESKLPSRRSGECFLRWLAFSIKCQE